jgi:CRISPR-associated protein Cmr2
VVLAGDEFWKAKIATFLHDPPDKAAVLFHAGRGGHERLAEILRSAIGLGADEFARFQALAHQADRLAAGADRPPLSKGDRTLVDFLDRPRIIHPLSGQEYDLVSLATHDWRAVHEALLNTVRRIAEAYDGAIAGGWRRRYFSLWRELPAALVRDRGSSGIGSLWELLPADTRTPDHTIWDHLHLASALAGALVDGQPSLLLFSLGPVQSFIAAARKTQDLWAGSWILSWLAWCAMRPLVEKMGPDAVIFPSLFGQPLVDDWLEKSVGLGGLAGPLRPEPWQLAQASLPNRFLAVVPRSLAAEVADGCERSFRDALRELGTESLRAARDIGEPRPEILDLTTAQLEGYFEARWVAVPWSVAWADAAAMIRTALVTCDGEEPTPALALAARLRHASVPFWISEHSGSLYGDLYTLTERSLAAVKQARTFGPLTMAPGARCAQTGELEPVAQGKPRLGEPADPKIPQTRDLTDGERLSAVVLVKRTLRRAFPRLLGIGEEEVSKLHFPSTGSIASAAYLEAVAGAGSPEAHALARAIATDEIVRDRGQSVPWRTHKKLHQARLREIGYLDARALFVGEGLPEYVDEDGRPLPPAVGAAAKALLDKHGAPTPYYAVVLADGDSMGAWLSGEQAPLLSEVVHSAALDQMSPEARRTLGELHRPLAPSLHAAISGAVRTFSRDLVPWLLEERVSGKLVYSGGDDVLALVPLRDLPAVLALLPHLFSGTTPEDSVPFDVGGGYVRLDGRAPSLLMGARASLSAGIVIAHQKEPFYEVLAAARTAENQAKSVQGKAAFAITLLKHSGQQVNVCAPWRFAASARQPASAVLLDRWSSVFGDGIILGETTVRVSPRAVRAFREEIAAIVDAVAAVPRALAAAADTFCASVWRHAAGEPEEELPSEAREELRTALIEPVIYLGQEMAANGVTRTSSTITAMLETALFLARHRGGIRGRVR